MCDSQAMLPAEPAFVRKVHRGLLTPRALMTAVFEDMGKSSDLAQRFGIENTAQEYAEPGYTQPAEGKCILFGNWNKRDTYNRETQKCEPVPDGDAPKRFSAIAEHLGYILEWSDEWTCCDNCYRAIRTNADSYSWTPYFVMDDNGIQCAECALEDIEALIDTFKDDAHRCIPADLARRIDFASEGWEKVNADSFESGWHPGQTDNPEDIASELASRADVVSYLFVQDEQSQFYTRFSVYILRTEDEDTEDEDGDDE
jgi:hypothetical protein